GTVKYPRGCEIPADVLKGCTSLRVLQDRKYIHQVPKVSGAVKSIAIAAPPKERPLPELKFFALGDALENYLAMKKAFIVELTGDESLWDRFASLLESGDQFAEQLQQRFENCIAADNRASAIYRVALRIAAERNAQSKHLTGRRPVQRI